MFCCAELTVYNAVSYRQLFRYPIWNIVKGWESTSALFQQHAASHSHLHTITPGFCPVQSQYSPSPPTDGRHSALHNIRYLVKIYPQKKADASCSQFVWTKVSVFACITLVRAVMGFVCMTSPGCLLLQLAGRQSVLVAELGEERLCENLQMAV